MWAKGLSIYRQKLLLQVIHLTCIRDQSSPLCGVYSESAATVFGLFDWGRGSPSRATAPSRRNRRMSSATDEATSMWLTEADKELIREYRNDVFDTEHVGLRHAVRHAINEAWGDEE